MFAWYQPFPWRNLTVMLLALCSIHLAAQIPIVPETPAVGSAAQPAPADTNASPQAAAPQPPLAPIYANAKLGVGDLIDVSVFGVPELTTRVRISGSGDLYLPLIDYVHVAGLSTDEAQDMIQKRLEDGGFVRSPHVSVFVSDSASQSVTVMGEVTHPGTYPAVGDRRLFDLISAAGGLSDKAGRMVTIQHRDGQKVQVQLSINLAEDDQSNIPVSPGDTIIVSRAGIVYVIGDVGHPLGFRIEDNSLSVLKALALAGGSTRTSALNRARILRETPNGIQEIFVNLKKVLYAKAPDMAMVKGDILFIPGSTAKAVAYKTAEAAVSLSTTLAVIGVETF